MKLQNFKSAVQKLSLAAGASLVVAAPSFAQETSLVSMVTEGLAAGDVKTAIFSAGGVLIGLAAAILGIRKVMSIIR